jgi:hypothetical protein
VGFATVVVTGTVVVDGWVVVEDEIEEPTPLLSIP